MTKRRKVVPAFGSEDEERGFRGREDSTRHVDWSRAERVTLPKLRPALKTISLRLPAPLLADLKRLANKRDVPYQSLLKVFLAERLEAELKSVSRSGSAD